MYGDDDDAGGGGGADVQERVLESERRKRHVDERRDTEARRHSDYVVKYALYAISPLHRSFTASNYIYDVVEPPDASSLCARDSGGQLTKLFQLD